MHSARKRLVFSLSIPAIMLIASSPVWIIPLSNIVRPIPKQKFYWREPVSINGINAWELKNLRSSGSYSLTMFYMIDKIPEREDGTPNLCRELIEKQKPVIQARIAEHTNKDEAQVEIYLETKSLPKYYKETIARNKWAQRDLINDHFDEQIATVFLNSNLEITDIWVIHAKPRTSCRNAGGEN